MIIFRKGDKKPYTFVDYKNNEVKEPEVLDYIKKLVIPPNYKEVKIFYEKKGQPKILYQGFDSKRRLQRIYSESWNKVAMRKKFCELLNFAEQIQRIKDESKKQMMVEKFTKNKMISIIIRLVMVCYFRIGNKKYQELYDSYGAMNILKKHVAIEKKSNNKNVMNISFKGKKGVLNSCKVTDQQLISEINKILKFREDDEMIFQWLDHGIKIPVRAIDINFWLKKFDPVITSKFFRTYDSNILLIVFLRAQVSPLTLTERHRKRIIVTAMKYISTQIHNTPAILRKNYTAGGIIDLYIKEPSKFMRYFNKENSPRQAFVEYLRDYCKDYDKEKEKIIKKGGKGIKLR